MNGKRSFFATLCLFVCVCPSLLAQQAKPSSQPSVQIRYVDIGGYKLTLQVAGAGAPTVVFDYGLGGGLENWNDVFPKVARFTRVVAYDRAGYGKSEKGPEPRSFSEMATELHDLLQSIQDLERKTWDLALRSHVSEELNKEARAVARWCTEECSVLRTKYSARASVR